MFDFEQKKIKKEMIILMSIQINSHVGEMNSLAPVNVLERNISENTNMLENIAEDTAYDTYETSKKEDENTAIPCENYNDILQTMKYAKVEQMNKANTEDDSAYEEARKNK